MEQNKIQKELLVHLIQQQNQFKSLKAEVDKIDIDNLKTVPADLSKIRNVVNNDVVKETIFDNWSLRLMPLIRVVLGLKKTMMTLTRKYLKPVDFLKKH